MGIFEKYLTIWIASSILIGWLLGLVIPSLFTTISELTIFNTNVIIAILIWLMIYPMMCQVEVTGLTKVFVKPKGLILTLIINWAIKPFSMALLAWLFLKIIFGSILEPSLANEYIAGMILLGVAPCTAMVFIWSSLTKGDPNYTLVQVSINDLIMIVAFAPIAGLLLEISNIEVPWSILITSVVLYILIPLIAGVVTRKILIATDDRRLSKLIQLAKPLSIIGLLLTVIILFGLQSDTISTQLRDIVLISIPLTIQTLSIFILGYVIAYLIKLPHNIAGPACLIGTSNFFELAVAVAITLFGINSGASLATVVGVLIEVPVMLMLVWVVNRTAKWFPG
ncbi:MAG: ACR3 family arsenite efflux transporter [SAR202 cluster bacterium]|jgi:ACR3 family arsenite transporter|nr:ACR3 family arsenite efflux transporter [Dehalococcoidia bacterium]MQG36062.1 ACR3 family arsenite efflux transporter [SAR202 cluster bacterium]CAI8329407.1 MAG: Arsenical-resistance protein Acr3 [Chloroflexota bacterium]